MNLNLRILAGALGALLAPIHHVLPQRSAKVLELRLAVDVRVLEEGALQASAQGNAPAPS